MRNVDNEQTQPQSSTQAQAADPKPKKALSRAPKAMNNKINGVQSSLTSIPQLSTNNEERTIPPPQQNLQPDTSTALSIQPSLPTIPTATQPQLPATLNTPSIQQHTENMTSNSIPSNHLQNHQSHQQPQRPPPPQQPTITTDLTTYTNTPTPERITRLETWICEHIQDDEFLRLCQDVEGVWKRVAFGGGVG